MNTEINEKRNEMIKKCVLNSLSMIDAWVLASTGKRPTDSKKKLVNIVRMTIRTDAIAICFICFLSYKIRNLLNFHPPGCID